MTEADELRGRLVEFQAEFERFHQDANRVLYAIRRGGEPFGSGIVPDPALKSADSPLGEAHAALDRVRIELNLLLSRLDRALPKS
jgi:hypothetical protein